MGSALGAWADSRFGTSPVLLIVGVVFGFGAFTLRLVRLTKELGASAEADARTDERTDARVDGEDIQSDTRPDSRTRDGSEEH